jgi:transposase
VKISEWWKKGGPIFDREPDLIGSMLCLHSRRMPQLQLPVFPVGTTLITSELAFECRDNQVVYVNGHLPVFTHDVADVASFRLFTTQLIVNGTASPGQVVQAFGISATTVKRCVKRYREGGPKVFFAAVRRRQGSKLTSERLLKAQAALDEGESIPAISAQLGVLTTTLHKAIDSGRLRRPKKKTSLQLRRFQTPVAPVAIPGLSLPRANEA